MLDDFEFNFDFIQENEDIETLELKEKRVFFSLEKSFDRLCEKLKLPKKNETIRTISPSAGWSSCALVMWFAENIEISDLFITTLRVGKKELKKICELIDNERIKEVSFVLSDLSRENVVRGKKYDYQSFFEETCKEYNIKYKYARNHSKVILIKSKDYYVIETSSNFNENPKIEQFIISNSKDIYDFYLREFKTIGLI